MDDWESKFSVSIGNMYRVFTISFDRKTRQLQIGQKTQKEPEGKKISLAFCGLSRDTGREGRIDLPDQPNTSLAEYSLWDPDFTFFLIPYNLAKGWMQYITFRVTGKTLLYRIRIMPIPDFLCLRDDCEKS